MPTSTYKRIVSFSQRVDVSNEFIRVLCRELEREKMVCKHASMSSHGVEHSFQGPEDVLAITTSEFAEALSIRIWFRSEVNDDSLVARFDRFGKAGPADPMSFPSQLSAETSDPNLYFRLDAIRQLLEAQFLSVEEPSEHRFTACALTDSPLRSVIEAAETRSKQKQFFAPPSVSDQISSSTLPPEVLQPQERPQSAANEITVSKENNRGFAWILGILISLGCLFVYAMQAHIAGREAAANVEATFSLQSLPDGTADTPHAVTLNRRLTNVGKGNAKDVRLRCGDRQDIGPQAKLGTVAAGASKNLHFELDLSKENTNHTEDILCSSTIYLTYLDGNGSHSIYFDGAGNAVETALQ